MTQTTLRIDKDLLEMIVQEAIKDDRSINSEMIYMFKYYFLHNGKSSDDFNINKQVNKITNNVNIHNNK